MEIIDDYKYSLSRLFSVEQIKEMRKQLKEVSEVKANEGRSKIDKDFYCNKQKLEVVAERRPKRVAA